MSVGELYSIDLGIHGARERLMYNLCACLFMMSPILACMGGMVIKQNLLGKLLRTSVLFITISQVNGQR